MTLPTSSNRHTIKRSVAGVVKVLWTQQNAKVHNDGSNHSDALVSALILYTRKFCQQNFYIKNSFCCLFVNCRTAILNAHSYLNSHSATYTFSCRKLIVIWSGVPVNLSVSYVNHINSKPPIQPLMLRQQIRRHDWSKNASEFDRCYALLIYVQRLFRTENSTTPFPHRLNIDRNMAVLVSKPICI